MPAASPAKFWSNPHRTRALILALCSLAIYVVVLWYHPASERIAFGLLLLQLVLLWLAMFEITRSRPRRTKLMGTLASAVLWGMALLLIIAAAMALLRRPIR